jgi:hypothetical protein
VKRILAGWMLLLPALAFAEVTANDPLPAKILTCGGSIIKEIETGPPPARGELSTGSYVAFNNGGTTVGYDTPDAVRSSKVGDHVLVCLVYIPKDCPPGDNRGRVYSVTNLRTLQVWSGADSKHACGGA